MFETISLNTNKTASNKYAQPVFTIKHSRPSPSVRYASALEELLQKIFSISTPNMNSWTLHEANKLDLDEFLQRHESERNELTLKKLKGENLETVERLLLQFLNNQLDDFFAVNPSENEKVFFDALNEAKRITAAR